MNSLKVDTVGLRFRVDAMEAKTDLEGWAVLDRASGEPKFTVLLERDPGGEVVQHRDRSDHVGRPARGGRPQARRDGDHLLGGAAAEPCPDDLRGGDHQVTTRACS